MRRRRLLLLVTSSALLLGGLTPVSTAVAQAPAAEGGRIDPHLLVHTTPDGQERLPGVDRRPGRWIRAAGPASPADAARAHLRTIAPTLGIGAPGRDLVTGQVLPLEGRRLGRALRPAGRRGAGLRRSGRDEPRLRQRAHLGALPRQRREVRRGSEGADRGGAVGCGGGHRGRRGRRPVDPAGHRRPPGGLRPDGGRHHGRRSRPAGLAGHRDRWPGDRRAGAGRRADRVGDPAVQPGRLRAEPEDLRQPGGRLRAPTFPARLRSSRRAAAPRRAPT